MSAASGLLPGLLSGRCTVTPLGCDMAESFTISASLEFLSQGFSHSLTLMYQHPSHDEFCLFVVLDIYIYIYIFVYYLVFFCILSSTPIS